MVIVGWMLVVLGLYLAAGLVFAAWFVTAGVGRISPAARGTGWGFRLLIVPGSAALWPLLAWEFIASRGKGGMVVGRTLEPDDVETATEPGVGGMVAEADDSPFVDPEADTAVEGRA
jgi:hypothetical protein